MLDLWYCATNFVLSENQNCFLDTKCFFLPGGAGYGGFFGSVDETEAIQSIHQALKLGLNYVDTSPWYGHGKSESLLGKVQVVYLIFELLWNLVREPFAPVWSLSKVFILRNLVVKSLQKIWSENIQKRRPRGSSIKHGENWPAKFGQMCLPQIFQVYPLHLSEL